MNKEFQGFKANENVYVEAHFQCAGRDCIVIFCKRGYRCGYVSLKDDEVVFREHELASGKKYKEVDYDRFNINCHGGLTYGNSLNQDYKPNEKYYVGFDCAHCWDGTDNEQAIKYGFDELQSFIRDDENPCILLGKCICECKSIANQLNEFSVNAKQPFEPEIAEMSETAEVEE